jgi:hypothetical protein
MEILWDRGESNVHAGGTKASLLQGRAIITHSEVPPVWISERVPDALWAPRKPLQVAPGLTPVGDSRARRQRRVLKVRFILSEEIEPPLPRRWRRLEDTKVAPQSKARRVPVQSCAVIGHLAPRSMVSGAQFLDATPQVRVR